MKLSIVTLTYNQLEEATRPYIESLYQYTNEADFKLILVDNGSTDGTVEYLKTLPARYGNIKLILNPQNTGYPKGNNQGLELVSPDTQYIGLFNNDILFTPNWLGLMIEAFERDPKIGLASARINKNNKINKDNYLSVYRKHLATYKEPFSPHITPFFCCVMMRRETFEKVGFLDEGFSPAFFEDDDYSFRTLYAGFHNGYVNTTFILHNHCTTTGKMDDKKGLIERNRLYFYDKHYLGRYLYEQDLNRRKPLRRLKSIFTKLFN